MTKQFDEQPGSLTLSSPELARMIDISAVQAFHTEKGYTRACSLCP